MKKIILSLLLCAAHPLCAVLAPLNQSIQELKVLLESKELGTHLSNSEKIQEIKSIRNGYLVITNKYEMYVEVHYLPQKRPGPALFELIFHKPLDLSEE